MSRWLQVLLLTAAVAVVPLKSPCESDQYELHGLCCDFCPAGSYVSRVCDVDRVTECSPCEPGSFTAHRNQETACLPCAQCRDDQELVSDCTRDSDRRCQCKTGSFYCDSEDCVETCFRCSRCDGPALETCNATRDTVCATERHPEPGDPPKSPPDSSHVWAVAGPVTLVIAVIAVIAAIAAIAAICSRRQGVQLPHLVVRWLKRTGSETGVLGQYRVEQTSQGGRAPGGRGPPHTRLPTCTDVTTRHGSERAGGSVTPRPGVRAGWGSERSASGEHVPAAAVGVAPAAAPARPAAASGTSTPPTREQHSAGARTRERGGTWSPSRDLPPRAEWAAFPHDCHAAPQLTPASQPTHESRDAGDPSQGGPQSRVILLPRDVEHSPAASGEDSTPMLGPQGAAVAPSEDPEGGVQLQAAVPTGNGPAPEQALQTQNPSAPRGPDPAGAAAPLHALQQQYEEKYVLKDGSPEAMNRIYFEFGQEVPRSNWRMFMRLAGLEENDIVVCEHENPGNLPEQHHRMLLRWQSKLGRAATPFRLMAALCKLRLRECLENIINKLLAEDILGSKDAEPPN